MKIQKIKTGSNNNMKERQISSESIKEEKINVIKAHDEAEKDMEADADLTAQSKRDDLDEGEFAKLEQYR